MVRQEPIRILHIVTNMGIGGLETLLMNVFRNIDREKVQFDFLVHREERATFDDEIEALGGRIFRLPRLNPFSPGYRRAVLNFFRQHPEYRLVHCHQDCLSAIPLTAAKNAGVLVRIAHSHTTNQDKNLKYLVKRYYMRKTPAVATHFFACSAMAGDWMFPGQQVVVVKNGIETARFAFSPEIRAEIRRELGLGDKLVVGHVGNFSPTKNHGFLLDVFQKVHEKRPEAVLLLAGVGPLEMQTRKKARELGLEEAVRFLGLRNDANRLYQAMDVFVMPSLYEGFSLCTVEAQTSGVASIFSDRMPPGSKMTDTVELLSLEERPAVWADRILEAASRDRKSGHEEVTAAGYDIQTTASWLQNFYLENWDHA